MNVLSQLVKAPIPYKIGDKTYELSPLDNGAIGAFQQFIQFREYHALRSLPDVAPELLRETMLTCAKKVVTFHDQGFLAHCDTAEGGAEVVYLSVRIRQPEVTREELTRLGMKEIGNMVSLVMIVSGWLDDAPEEVKKNLTERVESLRAEAKIGS